MGNINPDDIFEKFILMFTPLWGPFYAVYYILRELWQEIFGREQ